MYVLPFTKSQLSVFLIATRGNGTVFSEVVFELLSFSFGFDPDDYFFCFLQKKRRKTIFCDFLFVHE